MVFLGPRGVVKTPTRGRFHCPRCDVPRPYAYRRVRRFFALFHVPLVPLKGEQDFVQCGYCRRAFLPSVLESDAPLLAAEARRNIEERLAGSAATHLLVWEVEAEASP